MTVGSSPARPWALDQRRLYLCTPDRPDLEVFVGRCIAGGVDIVQLREKHLGDAELVRRAATVHKVCAGSGVPFILNDRPDLAAAMGADGVHIGQDDLSPFEARSIVGDQAIIGLSTHAPHELAVALGTRKDEIQSSWPSMSSSRMFINISLTSCSLTSKMVE